MTIIDFRLRPPLEGFLDAVMYSMPERRNMFTRQLGLEPAPSAEARSLDLLFQEMDACGVTKGVVVGRNSGSLGAISNRQVAEICRRHPERFVGLASVDPSNRKMAIGQIREARELGLKGVNIEPGAYPLPLYPDDRRLYPIYAYCEDEKLPVVVMTGGNAGPDLSYTSPVHIDRVLADFPALTVVASHGNWPWVQEILHVAFRRQNLHLSPDMYLCNMPGMDDYIKAANGFLQDRFLFATAYPLAPVRQYTEWFLGLPISEQVKEKVLHRNAVRVLGLDD